MQAVRGKHSGTVFALSPSALLGQGTEGRVYCVGALAVKIFTAPLSGRRAEKIDLLAKLGGRMPGFAWPKDVVLHPTSGAPVGEIQDFIPGEALQDILDRRQGNRAGQSLAVKVRLARQVAQAVAAAHAVKRPLVVLGDVIKAANLRVAGKRATFVDASSANVLGYRSTAGSLEDAVEKLRTPGYVPPEVLSNPAAKPSHLQDRFSLAVLLFEILFGRPPTDCPAAVGLDPDDAILRGIFPRYLSDPDYPPPTYELPQVPDGIEDLFRSAFLTVADRPKADRWVVVLTAWERILWVEWVWACVRVVQVMRPRVLAGVVALLVLTVTVLAFTWAPRTPFNPPKAKHEQPDPPAPSVGPAFFQEYFK